MDYPEQISSIGLFQSMNRKLATLFLTALFWISGAFGGEIHVAAASGDLEKVRALLKENPELTSDREEHYQTPLHLAGSGGHTNVAKLLLAYKADVNAKDGIQRGPLHLAASHGHNEMVELLLANGANVDAKNDNGDTPLVFAACGGLKGHLLAAKLLLASGANVNAHNNGGFTPLHLAAQFNRRDMVEWFLANKADVNA